jgi:hypothetical protein
MKRPPHLPLLLLLLVLPFFTGCAAASKPLQIEPARRTTPISPRFTQSYYYFDRDQTLYFVMRARANDAVTGQPVDQVATMRVFWRPKGGVTTLSASGINTTFRYVVMTPDAFGLYEGAGFVRLHSKNGDGKFNATVSGGDLRLTQSSDNFVDTLGRAHITGGFSAIHDDAKAMDLMLGAQREFFARSLESRTATQPATQPSPLPPTFPATVPAVPPLNP